MGVWSVIWSNFFGFDGLIFILFFINLFLGWRTWKETRRLYEELHGSLYMPSYEESLESAEAKKASLTEQQVAADLGRAEGLYGAFGTVTALFPLMGILGTVLSLLGMVGADPDLQGGFFAALTSTFWGLVFAILCKTLDGGLLAGRLENAARAAELFIRRRDNKPVQKKEEGAAK